ncbi:MAG: iron-sulfur cluster assembly scaffold protein [Nanoarchaeota archaeon]|nr:iron-sulfur cluster assembly scaffold protein [Nanoarchaeota archaeon]
MNLQDIYKQQLMDHAQHPRNQGILQPADIDYYEVNTTCGDELRLTLQLKNGLVHTAQFTGKGCVISQSAASLMTEHFKGKNITQLKQLNKEDVLKILGTTVAPGRIKCATLILKTLQRGIYLYERGEHHAQH